jgi:hypothetical protein
MIYYLSGKDLYVIEREGFTAFFCRTALADGPSRLETKPRDASRIKIPAKPRRIFLLNLIALSKRE